MISRTTVASLSKASILVFFSFWLDSCTQKSLTTASSAAYSEDISKYRPKVESYTFEKKKEVGDSESIQKAFPEPTSHLKAEIDEIVEKTIDYNKSRRYINGFSVQVYSGTEKKEKDEAELKVYEIGESPKTTFTSPIYKVKIGRFYTRLEATKFLDKVQQKFPYALLVAEKIRIN